MYRFDWQVFKHITRLQRARRFLWEKISIEYIMRSNDLSSVADPGNFDADPDPTSEKTGSGSCSM
jgi:hypothetical protein